jgi:hypothetical protein
MKQKDFRQKCSRAVLSKVIGLLVIVACFCTGAHAQVTIGNGDTPASGALLDVKEKSNTTGGVTSTKGILFPRVELTALNSLNPLTGDKLTHKGIVVYNINVSGDLKEGLYSWSGSRWIYVQDDPQAWNKTGNAGTDPTNNYVGTSDAKALSIRTDAKERIRVGEDGKTYLKSIGGTDASTNNVSQLVRDNDTGELLSLVAGKNSKALNYLVYRIECSDKDHDWIQNFDTKIGTDQFTLVVVGSSFWPKIKNSGLNTSIPTAMPAANGTFSPSTIRAFSEKGTWRLEADYSGGAPADGKAGTWDIYCLAINNSIVKTVPITNGNYEKGAAFKLDTIIGAAPGPPAGLYE